MSLNSFDDLVFEHRNKEYGAYLIRKKYSRTIIIALIICLLLSITTVVIPFVVYKSRIYEMGSRSGRRPAQLTIQRLEPPKEEIFSVQSIAPPPVTTTLKYVVPQIVDSIPELKETRITEPELKEYIEAKVNTRSDTDDKNDAIFGIGENGLPGDYEFLEFPPSFKGGGTEKFRDWIGRKTIFPKQAQDSSIYGTVLVTFVIEKDGSVSNVKIIKGVEQSIDNETLRVISSSPKWKPGIAMGNPVRVRCSISLIFRPF
jgi:protein TonB